MSRSTKNFFALVALLEASSSSRRPKRRLTPAQLTAISIVRHQLLPILRAAFETYPEKDTEEVLAICEYALADVLVPIIEP
jgi:hypothetical protein